MHLGRPDPRWLLVASAVALAVLAAGVPLASSAGANGAGNLAGARIAAPRTASTGRSATRVVVFDVLKQNGIAGVRFGASPRRVRGAIASLLGQHGGAYQRGGSCDLDHQITWFDQWTASGQPALTVYFHHAAFAGYAVGTPGNPRHQLGGWALATSRGLRVGDSLARGRRLYGRAFSLSSAQGGTWKSRMTGGRIDGYAWGAPRYGDVSWQSVVATIDAGDVGCPAIAP